MVIFMLTYWWTHCSELTAFIQCLVTGHSNKTMQGNIKISNLIYLPLLSQSQTVVLGGDWNCQSAVGKADFNLRLAFLLCLHFLELIENSRESYTGFPLPMLSLTLHEKLPGAIAQV